MQYKNYDITITPDEFPESPREWDNLGTLICFHKRYNLGDETDLQSDQFRSWGDLEKYIRQTHDPVVVLPVYLYDHSGLRIKIGPFYGLLPQGHAEFDSGQIGYIFVTKKRVRDKYGVRRISRKLSKKISGILQSEISAYDDYLIGDVWSYTIERDGEIIDSLSGIYHKDAAENDAKSYIDYIDKKHTGKQEG